MLKRMGSGWAVFSEKGKQLSKVYPTKEGAAKRLKEIEFFKHKKSP